MSENSGFKPLVEARGFDDPEDAANFLHRVGGRMVEVGTAALRSMRGVVQ